MESQLSITNVISLPVYVAVVVVITGFATFVVSSVAVISKFSVIASVESSFHTAQSFRDTVTLYFPTFVCFKLPDVISTYS